MSHMGKLQGILCGLVYFPIKKNNQTKKPKQKTTKLCAIATTTLSMNTFCVLSNVTLWHRMQPWRIPLMCLPSSHCVHGSRTLPPSPPLRCQVSCCCMECAKGNPSVAYPNSIFCSVELNWSKHSFSTAPFTTFQHFTVHNIIWLHESHNWPKTPYAKLVRFSGRSISSFHSYHIT